MLNISRHKPAYMSSYYGNGYKEADGAVDGDYSTVPFDIIHTDVNQPSAWWFVDLEMEVSDPTVVTYLRTGCEYRNLFVEIKRTVYLHVRCVFAF